MAQAARLASRLQRELKMLQGDPPPGVSAWPCDGHILTHLQAQIHGPEGTVYANGIFKLDIQVPERYPFEPPNIKFITPVYHPNIDNGGRICLDLLNLPPKGAWRPSLNLSTLLASIGLLLSEPNPDDGLMGDIAAEYKHDRSSFDVKARNWTEVYASQDHLNSELNTSLPPPITEPNKEVETADLHGQEQAQASRSFEEPMKFNCTTSSLPLRPSLSLSKRLALDRGTACLEETKADSSQKKSFHTDSVNSTAFASQSQSEKTSLCTKADAQVLQEHEKQFNKVDVCETSTSIGVNMKSPSWTKESVKLCNYAGGDISDEMAASSDSDVIPSHSAPIKRSLEVGKGPQSDGCDAQSISMYANKVVTDAERRVQTSGHKRKDTLSAGKENRPQKLCLATKVKDGNFKDLAREKGLSAEGRPMAMSSNFNSLPGVKPVQSQGGAKDRDILCLPARTKSLKLTRAKPDSNPLHSTKEQQNMATEEEHTLVAEKKWSNAIVIPDDAPIVVVSDSESDSEPSFECSTFSLTQRDLSNKRKANLKLR